MNKNAGKVKWTVVLGVPDMDHAYWKLCSPSEEDLKECWAPNPKAPQKAYPTKAEAEKEAKKLVDGGYDKYKVRVQKFNIRKLEP